jgi:hypothetical protein
MSTAIYLEKVKKVERLALMKGADRLLGGELEVIRFVSFVL